eukprot:gb/GECH01000640.1/.p1 GENE.gb/GECH01000640.1/~~gb/GECH01000640.1/.p1  ORF type:complete len:105 (+),score=22.83 gb/GECH01000640.1/:1-315(+)
MLFTEITNSTCRQVSLSIRNKIPQMLNSSKRNFFYCFDENNHRMSVLMKDKNEFKPNNKSSYGVLLNRFQFVPSKTRRNTKTSQEHSSTPWIKCDSNIRLDALL